MATTLSVAHSHTHSFFTIILLVTLSECATWWAFLNAFILNGSLPMTLRASIFVLSKILVRIGVFVIFIFLLMLLPHVFWGTINLLKPLVADCGIYWHLTTSTRCTINDPLLVRLTSTTSTFVSCRVTIKVAIVSTAFISLTRFKVVFGCLQAVNLIFSMLKTTSNKVWTSVGSHLLCPDLKLLNWLLLISGYNLLSMKFWNQILMGWYYHLPDLTDLFPIEMRINLNLF